MELTVSAAPSSSSPSVVAASTRLSAELDLPRLASALHSVGASLTAAHDGAAASHDMQVQIQRAGFRVTTLGDRTGAQLRDCAHAADAALDDLDCVRDLLQDGMPDVALDALRGADRAGSRLAAGAGKLAEGFEEAAGEVQRVLRLVVEKRAEQERVRAELAASVSENRVLMAQATNAKLASEDSFDEADVMYHDALQREGVATMKNNAIQVAQVATAVASFVSQRPGLGVVGIGGVSALAGAVEGEVLRVREEKAVYLHERHKQRLSTLDHGKELAEISARLRVMREEDGIARGAVSALEDAVSGLRALAGAMLRAEAFWSRVDDHCGAADMAALEGLVEATRGLGDEERAKVLASDHFARRTAEVYAPWVAMRELCADFGGRVGAARAQLYGLVEEAGDVPRVEGFEADVGAADRGLRLSPDVVEGTPDQLVVEAGHRAGEPGSAILTDPVVEDDGIRRRSGRAVECHSVAPQGALTETGSTLRRLDFDVDWEDSAKDAP